MKKNSGKISDTEGSKNKKSAGEIVSKLLTVLCAIAAVALIGVTAIAFISENNEKAPDTGEAVPEIITTEPATEPFTLASADTVKVKGTVYLKAQADVLAQPSENAPVVTKLQQGDSVGFVSQKSGWCTVVYEEKVCYIHRDYLTTKKPQSATTTTEPEAAAAAAQATERKVVKLDRKLWSLVVVDKNRQIPDGYEPELEYVAGSDHTLDSRVAVYYDAMYKAAYDDGVVLTPYSGYRRYSTQESNYNALVDQYINQGYSQNEAEDMASTEILPPGCSEHNLGLAMDISGTEESFRDTEEYKWLCENAHTYGFIERYPEGTQEITGVIAEPWHWRFIGPSYAEDMKSKGIKTLEEYLQHYGKKY